MHLLTPWYILTLPLRSLKVPLPSVVSMVLVFLFPRKRVASPTLLVVVKRPIVAGCEEARHLRPLRKRLTSAPLLVAPLCVVRIDSFTVVKIFTVGVL